MVTLEWSISWISNNIKEVTTSLQKELREASVLLKAVNGEFS